MVSVEKTHSEALPESEFVPGSAHSGQPDYIVMRAARGSKSEPDQPESELPGRIDAVQGGGSGDLETLSRVSTGLPYSVFSGPMKKWIIAMATASSFVSPVTANIYFPAIPALSKDLSVSVGLINLTLTTYTIFQAIAPTFFGDFGDMAGRRPAFIIAFTIYLGANIGLALQRNYAALLVLRCLQSGGSSGTLALGYAVVADLSTSAERGKYMGIVGAGISIGPAFGPVLGGILTQYLGWPSIFWFLAIFTSIWLVGYILAVPETGRKVVGNGSIPPQTFNMTLLDYVRFRRQVIERSAAPKQKIRFPNPLRTLSVLLEKDMAMVLLYNSTLYVGFYMVGATLSPIFDDIYHYSDLVNGLCYLPLGLACTISSVIQGYILDWNYRRIAQKTGFKIDKKHGDNLKDFPIEKARIQIIRPILYVGAAAYIAYGWALVARTSVVVPLVLQFLIGLFVTGSFAIINTLIVDLYPDAPATATAANNFVRCSMGAAATAVIDPMLRAMGRGWTFTVLAALFTVTSPVLWVIERQGPKWREQRRLKKLKQTEMQSTSANHSGAAEK